MRITTDHWLDTATREAIPGGAAMGTRRFLVIHFTGGASALSSIDWWRRLDNGVCAHFVIDRDGTIYQCRPCDRTAGHAGASRWVDPNTGISYNGLNHCSLGIELANAGDNAALAEKWSDLTSRKARHRNGGPVREWERYPKAQIAACTELARVLVARYNLDDLVGHEDIAPERKNDPGPAFPMLRVREACGFSGLPKRHS